MPTTTGAALAAVALVLSSCSGGAGGAAGPRSASPATTTAQGPGVSFSPVAHPINQAVWFGGFKLTLGTAVLQPGGPTRRRVDIDTAFANQGAGSVAINAYFDLSSGAQRYPFDDVGALLPQVAAHASAFGKLSFDVDQAFSFADAVLTLGRDSHQQATVPLGSRGRLATLQPVAVAVTGSVAAGALKVAMTGGELRSDNPRDYTEAAAGKRFFDLVFDVSAAKPVNFAAANLALRLPDGSNVAARDVVPLIVGAGTVQQGQQARFVVSDPTAGAARLALIDDSTRPPLAAELAVPLPPAA